MQKLMNRWVVGAMALGLGGCAGDPSTMETEADALAALQAVTNQFSLVSGGIDYSQGSSSGSAELACADGGMSKVNANTSASISGNSITGKTTQQGSFDACHVGEVTMDGDYTVTATTSFSNENISVSSRYAGTVTFAGNPEGICRFNLTIDASINDATNATTQKISGTICGFPAEDIYPNLPGGVPGG